MTRALVALALLLPLAACGQKPPPAQPLVGPYSVTALDDPLRRSVCIQREDACVQDVLPGPAVVAVGFDQRHLVIVRQTPGETQDAYYYVVRHPDEQSALGAANVHGPMTAEAFAAEQTRLRLPQIAKHF
jgi:hypothetical protein